MPQQDPDPQASAPPATSAPEAAGLALTGERTLPGIADERYWFVRHEVAYRHVARDLVVAGMHVLDAGCGEGYGLALLAEAGAARIVGVDLDATTIAHVRRRYAAVDPRIEAIAAEFGSLPLDPDTMDLTVSLQVIEHVWDVAAYLDALVRVTRPGASIVIATPNRLTFTPDSDTPVNPFHVTEFAPDELRSSLVDAGLEVTELLGLHHTGEVARFEAEAGCSLPVVLGETEPSAWSKAVRTVVHATSTSDFTWRSDALGDSLDLLAICRVPG